MIAIHYQNTSIEGCQIRYYEEPHQVFSDNKDREESIMTMKNMFNNIIDVTAYYLSTSGLMPAFCTKMSLKK